MWTISSKKYTVRTLIYSIIHTIFTAFLTSSPPSVCVYTHHDYESVEDEQQADTHHLRPHERRRIGKGSYRPSSDCEEENSILHMWHQQAVFIKASVTTI